MLSEQHLFVYGTLKRGQRNAFRLQRLGGRWRKARVHGRLFKHGVLGTQGYPALILSAQITSAWVNGYVFSAKTLAKHWPVLDAFEGAGYRRVSTKVALVSGSNIQAYVYVPAYEKSIKASTKAQNCKSNGHA